MTASKTLYDARYLDGYRKKLSGYEIARWNAMKHFFQRIVRYEQPHRILDYGCGNGLFYPLFRSLFPAAEIFGADISSVAIAQLQKKFPEFSGKTSLVNENKTIFPDRYFDIIVSVEVLEHVEKLDDSIQEIGRVLKKDGVFVWTTPCANRFSIEHLYSVFTKQVDTSAIGQRRWKWEDPAHLRRLTSSEAAKELERQGFYDLKFRFRAHLFSFVCTRMSLKIKKLSPLLEKLMALDYVLFRRLANGASMIGAAKKR
jgi:ubiquinone/menaquinone biosynthesis C-methylase UbiE